MLRLLAVLLVAARTASCADTNSPHYVGCYTDSEERQLNGFKEQSNLNTPDFCIGLCYCKGFSLAGMASGKECLCGNTLKPGTKVDDRECGTACPGQDSVKCGAVWRLSVYRTNIPGKGFDPVASSFLGCYEDNSNRILSDDFMSSDILTPDFCVNHCKRKGYSYAGMEIASECYCGNNLEGGAKKKTEECNFECSGDKSLKCGSYWRLRVYKTSISGRGINRVKSNYVGCYVDSDDRQLKGFFENNPSLTPEACVAVCYKKGFSLAGTEVGEECYCGDSLKEGTKVDDSECRHGCKGDNLLACGFFWRLSVYRTSALGRGFNPVSSNYIGCYKESKDKQLNGANRKLTILTPDYCVTFCKAQGYRLAGLQDGSECYCGDTLKESTKVEDGECNKACGGDLALKCGSDQRLSVYTTSENLRSGPTQYLGCFEEYSEDRLFSGDTVDSENINVDVCIGFCYRRGFLFAGMQYGEGCFCGNSLRQRQRAPNKECGIPCGGDKYQKCGGNWRISVYSTGLAFSDKSDFQLPTYMGCFKDHGDRQLYGAKKNSGVLTPDVCSSFCYRKGFRLAGLEVGFECYCGDNLKEGTVLEDKECKSICAGDPSIFCGWYWRLSVYRTSIPAHLVNSFYVGCFEESDKNRILIGDSKQSDHMTIDYCVGYCYRRGYIYAGLQNGEKCFCGNTLNQRDDKPLSQCDSVCAGDKTEFCGGNWKASIYHTGIKHPVLPSISSCQKSKTTSNGKPSCQGELLFNEDFNAGIVDRLKWSNSRFMPSVPDNEFVVFGDNPQNVYAKDGFLFIKPTLNDGVSLDNGQLTINDCTGTLGKVECFREAIYYFILPPVQSARIHTKESFSFRYGTVQVRAKLPAGDWIVPELWLVPKENLYGPNYASGKIRMAMSRGNRILSADGTDIGNNRLETGIMMGINDDIKWKYVHWPKSEGWHKRFHNFSFTWTPDSFLFSVDGQEQRLLSAKGEQKLSNLVGFQGESPLWNKGSNLAPFDNEFYISLGVAVGGIRDFPDECISNSREKPWSDSDAKATLNFWNDKDNWYSTWKGEESALQIDYIKVSAL